MVFGFLMRSQPILKYLDLFLVFLIQLGKIFLLNSIVLYDSSLFGPFYFLGTASSSPLAMPKFKLFLVDWLDLPIFAPISAKLAQVSFLVGLLAKSAAVSSFEILNAIGIIGLFLSDFIYFFVKHESLFLAQVCIFYLIADGFFEAEQLFVLLLVFFVAIGA